MRGTTIEKLQHRDFLVSMHVIYGVDEVTLAGYTSQAIINTHDVDEKILQQVMRQNRTTVVASRWSHSQYNKTVPEKCYN